MSDGLKKVAGAPSEVEIAGRKFTLDQLRYGHFAEIEQHIISQRPDLVAKLAGSLDKCSPELQDKLIAAAMRQMDQRKSPTAEETQQFFNSISGQAFVFWLMAREHHPELKSHHDAAAILKDVPIELLKASTDRASGLPDLKNSDGQFPSAELAEAAADSHEHRGLESISN